MKDIMLSDYGNVSSEPSPAGKLMASFAENFRDGVDINLGVGYVNERTIPREFFQEAVREVLADPQKYRAAMNYGGAEGSANLIESLKKFYLENNIGKIDEKTLNQNKFVIGPSGATSILEGIARILPRGIVITSDPMYYIYCNYLERLGFEVVTIPEDEGGIDPEMLSAKLEDLEGRWNSIRFFYFVTVNNPTCTIMTNEKKKGIVEVAGYLSEKIGRKIPVIFDQAYDLLIHDPEIEEPESALLHDPHRLVYEVGTLSKVFAPALRIGYILGQDGPFLRALIQKTFDVGFSASLIMQEVASQLLDNYVGMQLKAVKRGYRIKAMQTLQALTECLGRHLENVSGGQAGFYYYLTLSDMETAPGSPFFKFLARTSGDVMADGPTDNPNPRLIYIPGKICVHPNGSMVEQGRRQLRISYGYEDMPGLQKSFELLKNAASYAENNKE